MPNFTLSQQTISGIATEGKIQTQVNERSAMIVLVGIAVLVLVARGKSR